MNTAAPRIAVIGAGMAGALCARRLRDAGADVHLFEKSRGVGGRMATRRVRWIDEAGVEHAALFDHGAPGFSARSAAFSNFVEQAAGSRQLSRWLPAMAAGSFVPLDGLDAWIPTPGMPDLCRRLIGALPVTFGETVDAIQAAPGGWRVEARGVTLGCDFEHVVLAMPAPQAATLLAPHRRDWSELCLRQRMLPCWTLIGVADPPADPPMWDVAWPLAGPLAWVIRNDRKPGRASPEGRIHWVAHANAAWSETHLEAAEETVRAALLSAIEDCLGRPPTWRFSQVHRWRHASVARPDAGALQRYWFDPGLGLGVCGDHLGGAGVEGAWISGNALAGRVAQACDLVCDPGPSLDMAPL